MIAKAIKGLAKPEKLGGAKLEWFDKFAMIWVSAGRDGNPYLEAEKMWEVRKEFLLKRAEEFQLVGPTKVKNFVKTFPIDEFSSDPFTDEY
jgi:hypothetical protein